MVEVIHEHEINSNGGNNINGVLILIIAIIVIIFLFYYFGRGFLSGGTASPQVNIPDHVNVNVQQQKPAK